jgi:hypothetical protein
MTMVESNLTRADARAQSIQAGIQITLRERAALWGAGALHLTGEAFAWIARRIGRNSIGILFASVAVLSFDRAQTTVAMLALTWGARLHTEGAKPCQR